MQLNKLPIETAAILGSTHEVVIDSDDLTAAGTTQTLTVTIPAGSWVRGGAHVLETEFTDGGATIGTVSYTVGDDDDADLYMTSTQVEASGTVVTYKAPTPGAGAVARETGKVYASADTLDIAFTANAGELANLTGGKLRYYFALVDMDSLTKG